MDYKNTEIMTKYIGIATEINDPWYSLCILLYNKMIKIKLWTPKTKRPVYYWYNTEQFDYCINEMDIIRLGWFFGICIR